MLDRKLLEILVCPICKNDLIFDNHQQALISTAEWLAFPIRDGIPVMLESEARNIAVLEREKYQ